ncbi:MAG: glucose dehydrogenase, partial [bacterium]|nr:glucose dehydrogenase [bacterium]
GARCFLESNCDPADYVVPAVDYTHEEGLSVTGGYVYRGADIPELTGHYFYADWVKEWIRSFRYESGTATDTRDWTSQLRPGQITSFGIDGRGELLMATWDGSIARVVPLR